MKIKKKSKNLYYSFYTISARRSDEGRQRARKVSYMEVIDRCRVAQNYSDAKLYNNIEIYVKYRVYRVWL